jgi:error-prone DNA polymerase
LETPEVIDRFRQTGRWWMHEPETEHEIFIDSKGNRKEKVTLLGTFHHSKEGQETVYQEDHREDIDLRIRKTRDEKVAKACGLIHSPQLTLVQNRSHIGCLHTLSGYSFGLSSMLAEEIPALAANAGYSSALIADRFSLTGAYEFYNIARKVGIKPLIGASFELEEGGSIVLVAPSKRGYRNLSNLISECHLNEPRLFPLARREYLSRYSEDLICLTGGAQSPLNYYIGRREYSQAKSWLADLHLLYRSIWVEIEYSFLPQELRVNRDLIELAEHLSLPVIAGGPKTHATKSHFPALDVLTCASYLSTIEGSTERKPKRAPDQPQTRYLPYRILNSERYLLDVFELKRRYQHVPNAIENTVRLADMCDDVVLPSRTKLPSLCENEAVELTRIVESKVASNAPKSLVKRTQRELDRIRRLGFSGHFLVAADFCSWAKEQGIHFSARGSVVDSVVAYHLGFSRINAWEHKLHFDRFLPEDGTKRPDIDIDFEAFRRDEVRQYVSDKYGKDHVATVAAVGAYSTRGIIREVGKVMELPEETISYLAKRLHRGVSAEKLKASLSARPELRDSGIEPERYRWMIRLATRMTDVPRNMRAHSSGVVISSEPIRDTVPVQFSGAENVPIIQWDKRSAKFCFDKFDMLCLRGQDVLSDTEEQLRVRNLGFRMDDVPIDDESSYYAMRQGQLIGIPQSASPAMRQAHIRMRTQNLTDASLVQAGIRPGVGGAVKINELIARRRGKPFSYDHPLLEEILGNTYGIIVFQEQVDLLLQEFGGYTSGEAEDIRESIFKKRREEFASSIRQEVLKKIVNRGFAQSIAEQVYELVSGFNGYGFAQGHALAFAEISMRCIYLQQNYPSEYFSALLNSQPAGYYGPATIANEARNRGVSILPVCVNRSLFDFAALESAIRVGLRQIKSLSQSTLEHILRHQPFENFHEFVEKSKISRDELEIMILSGALDSIHSNRRELLWSMKDALDWAKAPLSSLPLQFSAPPLNLGAGDFSMKEKSVLERRYLGLDIERHLVAYERDKVSHKGGMTAQQIQSSPPGLRTFAVGNPIRLRFPPTKSGRRVVFFDLEDETGLLNVTCFDDVYMRDGHAIVCSPYATVMGQTQDRDGHIAFLASRVFPYRPTLTEELNDPTLPIATADYLVG